MFCPEVNTWIENQNVPYIGAEQAKQGIVKYVKGRLEIGDEADKRYAWDSVRECTRYFCTDGQMGTGKTRLQVELCKQKALCTAEDFGDYDVQFVRISYNEGFPTIPGAAIHTFARNLLMFHGMTQDDAEQVHSLDAAVKLLWKKVPWRSVEGKVEKRALVVCIDEFLSMQLAEDSERGNLMRVLAHSSDKSLGTAQPVIFMFSAVTKGMLATAAAVSGRRSVDPPFFVPELEPKGMLETLCGRWPHLKKRYERDTVLQLLVRISLSLPRALFDGIPAAFPKDKGTVTMQEAIDIVAKEARLSIRDIDLLLAEDVVERWVSRMVLPRRADAVEELVRWGVATPSQLKPLALRYWCGQFVGKESRSPPLVAYFLREAYVADLSVEPQQEKKAETFLYNFEAAKRGSYAHELFTLAEYYRGGSVRGVSVTVSAFPHTDIVKDNQVSKVDSFADETQTHEWLKLGSIVVSKKANEPGIEYLVPFFDAKSKQLKYVAAVQVKFSPEKNIGGGCKKICDTVMGLPIVEYLRKQDVTCFPVLFSTSHGGLSANTSEVEHGVLYDEAGLAGFTECLGPLRLHDHTLPKSSIGQRR